MCFITKKKIKIHCHKLKLKKYPQNLETKMLTTFDRLDVILKNKNTPAIKCDTKLIQALHESSLLRKKYKDIHTELWIHRNYVFHNVNYKREVERLKEELKKLKEELERTKEEDVRKSHRDPDHYKTQTLFAEIEKLEKEAVVTNALVESLKAENQKQSNRIGKFNAYLKHREKSIHAQIKDSILDILDGLEEHLPLLCKQTQNMCTPVTVQKSLIRHVWLYIFQQVEGI